MALRIYSNPLSVQAQNSVTVVNNSMQQSVERLSSGRRINHASDDASGFVVSQKMKAQIGGLAMANRNTQDGVSYLQTAEGGLDIMGQMVARMRELAVQASNGVYTTTDRTELQKEVDQLKSEIDRVSASTEFNTKKLLNGESTALTSTDSRDISTTVHGKVTASGSYQITVKNGIGHNAIYQSAILRTKQDEYNAFMQNSSAATVRSAYMVGTDKDLIGTMNFETANSVGYTLHFGESKTITPAIRRSVDAFLQADSTFDAPVLANVKVGTTQTTTGYYEYRITEFDREAIKLLDRGADAAHITSATTLEAAFHNGTFRVEWTFHDAKTGQNTGWQSVSNVKASKSGVVTFSIKSTSNIPGLSGGTLGGELKITSKTAANISLSTGDLFVVGTQGIIPVTTHKDGGTTITVGGGADGHEVQGTGGHELQVTYSNGELIRRNNLDERVDYAKARVYFGSLDHNSGTFRFGGMDVYVRESSSASTAKFIQGPDVHVFVQAGGSQATESTKLSQLASFTQNGREYFAGHNTQELTVYSNDGKSQKLTLVGDDTLLDVKNKFTEALVKLGLGAQMNEINASKYRGSVAATLSRINGSLVKFIDKDETTPDGVKSTPATFVMQSAKVGSASQFSVVGEEAIVNGLGLHQAQKFEDPEMKIVVRNLSTGQLVGQDTVYDGVFRGMNNLDVNINGTSGSYVYTNSASGALEFKPKVGMTTYHFTVLDHRTELQVGANEGQDFDVSVPELTTKSMRIDDAFVFSQEKASQAISKFDDALRQIASVRASIGAQVNRLGFTSTNLDTMRQNLVASNSRIEDADIASETSEYQRNQVLAQSSRSMLAQANGLTQSALSLLQA